MIIRPSTKDYPRDRCLHQLFEEQAERTPDAVAVVFEDGRLTYRELNDKANQLAHHLRNLGVGPEVLVGICVERSLEMVIGLLGILKAGGAYVPLDLAYPRERLALMLVDAGVKVLLTQEPRLAQLPNLAARVVCLDRDATRLAVESQENPPSLAAAENVAYVIYTSGSTGQPKGCLVTHYNVVRLFLATENWFHFRADDVWTLFHSVAFDSSVWEMWGAFLYGGRLVIVPQWVSRSPDAFYKLLVDQQVTVLNQTPSAFVPLMDVEQASGEGAGALRLRYLIFGGEALNVRTLQPWFDRHGDRQPQLVNMYGITETTVHVTYRPLTRQDLHRPASPIGHAIPDLELCLLDPHRQPVPIGVSGELYLGGEGLARGYRNRPELTAERFVTNPFEPGTRLYRTGDRVRWRADGTLEFLGRLDNQVKLRGFRIELGEIEAVLREHAGVAQSVVLLREDRPGDKRLVGYVVATDDEMPAVDDLHSYLKQNLPEYMVPSAFIRLKALPLTLNGNVDRRALPAPDDGRPELGHAYTAPHTPLEKTLAKIWAEMLGLERVGLHDNFFELGGHSLLAARVVDRVGKTMCKPIPLATIFRAPTIAELARHVESDYRNAHDFLEPIRPNGSGAVVLCFGGGLVDRLLELLPPSHRLYWCKLERVDGKRARYSKIEDLAAHYCRQISAAELEGPYVLCGYSFGGLVAFETARQLYERDRAPTLLFLVEPSLPKPSRKSPPSRIVHHLRRLPSVPCGQRGSYVYAKARACFQLLRRWSRQCYCGARLAFGLSVPVSMRWAYAEGLYYQAIARYVPQPFPGRVVLVTGSEYRADYLEQWTRMAEGGLTIHEMCSSGHGDLVANKQTIAQWAGLLSQYLKSPLESNLVV